MEKVTINKSTEAVPKIWGLTSLPFWLFIPNTVFVLFIIFSNISWLRLFLGLGEIGGAYAIALLLSDPTIINSFFDSSFPKSIKNDLF